MYRFMQEYGIPNVIGVIDGTQIGIYPPAITNAGHPEHVYVNRKNFHAINVQLVRYYSCFESVWNGMYFLTIDINDLYLLLDC